MARSDAQSVEEYLKLLPEDRTEDIGAVRDAILENLPSGYEETFQHGMLAYVVPLAAYPVTYNKLPLLYAALASQKNYMSVYLMNIYGSQENEGWFVDRYKASGKKLDMGKSCVRFKTLESLPVDLIGEAIAAYGAKILACLARNSSPALRPNSRSTLPASPLPSFPACSPAKPGARPWSRSSTHTVWPATPTFVCRGFL